ncbi:hypothetical protein AMTR_s00006p00242810 [Amborella trichopoda]|uniref:Uncharacterized protein n=1 Tax=Amborella trichopoda TaxID=13333 RepID=W1P778_AMBTC|nr:hypothetical protein AMTR_s00006p00242810 [Amborella trichopoda]
MVCLPKLVEQPSFCGVSSVIYQCCSEGTMEKLLLECIQGKGKGKLASHL